MRALVVFLLLAATASAEPLMQTQTNPLFKSMISNLAKTYTNDPRGACYYSVLGRGPGVIYVHASCRPPGGTAVSGPAVVKYSGDTVTQVLVPSPSNFQADVQRLFPADIQKKIIGYDTKEALDWLEKNTKKSPNSTTNTDGIYTSQIYKVTISYPKGWQPVSGALGERHVGADGHFQFGAVGGTSLDEVCNAWANHERRPFGSTPRIEKKIVSSQEGCLIWPSSDQPAQMSNQGALIVRYPKPVTISGRSYSFLVLWVSQKQLQSVVDSLKFS